MTIYQIVHDVLSEHGYLLRKRTGWAPHDGIAIISPTIQFVGDIRILPNHLMYYPMGCELLHRSNIKHSPWTSYNYNDPEFLTKLLTDITCTPAPTVDATTSNNHTDLVTT